MRKVKRGSLSYLNDDEIKKKYGDLVSALEKDITELVVDKRDPLKRMVPKLDIDSHFASSYIVEKYFLKNPSTYRENDKSLPSQRITANAIIQYLRHHRSGSATKKEPTSG